MTNPALESFNSQLRQTVFLLEQQNRLLNSNQAKKESGIDEAQLRRY